MEIFFQVVAEKVKPIIKEIEDKKREEEMRKKEAEE
jgi:hypothetical protein